MHAPVERVELFGLAVDSLSLKGAVVRAINWITEGTAVRRYVVSANVDHVVELQRNDEFKAAYANAAMVLADGMPVVWASRLLRRTLPESSRVRTSSRRYLTPLLAVAA